MARPCRQRMPPHRPPAGMEDTLLLPPGAMDMDISIDGPDAPTVVVPPTGRAGATARPTPQAMMSSVLMPTVQPAQGAPAQATASSRGLPPLSAPPVAGSLSPKTKPAARSSLMPLVLGVAVLAAVGVAVAAFWPRQASVPAEATSATINAEPSALPVCAACGAFGNGQCGLWWLCPHRRLPNPCVQRLRKWWRARPWWCPQHLNLPWPRWWCPRPGPSPQCQR
jgi:hypothetical protein